MASNSETTRITYTLTEEQRKAIQELFNNKGWTYSETVTDKLNQNQDEFDYDKCEPGYVIKHDEEKDECPFCLCKPCITMQQQSWFPNEPSEPHNLNNKDRKKCYRSFWTMLYHRRVWQDERYKAKKAASLGQPVGSYVYHRRDIMPNCVIKLIRMWYPNPQQVPYMGHMWE